MAIVLVASGSAATVGSTDIRPMLRAQGFSGPLNGQETIQYAGQIVAGGTDYQIYSYHGAFRAAVVDHGVNRLIVMRHGSTFFGEYAVPMPTKCKVRGRKVVCDRGTIEFTTRGPPQKINFDGENAEIQLGHRK